MALASVDVTPAAEQVCRQVAAWAAEPPPSAALSRAATEQPAVPPRAARVALWRAHARLAAEADEERTGGALEALAALKQLDGLCFDALAHVQRASSCLDLVAQRHAGLETQSAALQQQTSAQQETLAGLQALANALDVRLGPFRALATHRRLLEAPGLPATHPGLLPALEALDRAISDVASSASAARDSSELLAELRVLQASGLRAIAAHVSGALHSVASSAAVALREWAAEPPAGAGAAAGGEQPQGRGTAAAVPLPLLTPTDGPFAQAVHVRFHAVGTTLRPWLEQLERRAPLHREAAAVLLEAHGAYLAARTPLLRTALSAMLSRLSRSLASSAGCNADAGSAAAPASPAASAADLAHAAARVSAEQLADAARRAIAWFGRVVTLERELHEAVFRPEALLLKGAVLAGAGAGGAAGSGARGMGAALNAALERALCGVCMLLADWLRPAVLQADGVEGLADLALALREEAVSADSLGGALEPAPLAASCSSSPLSAAAAAVPGGTSAASVLSVTSVTSVPSVGSAGSALLAAASSSSALSLAIARALGDVQGRLAFRAQVEIRDRVRVLAFPRDRISPCAGAPRCKRALPGPGPRLHGAAFDAKRVMAGRRGHALLLDRAARALSLLRAVCVPAAHTEHASACDSAESFPALPLPPYVVLAPTRARCAPSGRRRKTWSTPTSSSARATPPSRPRARRRARPRALLTALRRARRQKEVETTRREMRPARGWRSGRVRPRSTRCRGIRRSTRRSAASPCSTGQSTVSRSRRLRPRPWRRQRRR